MRAGAFWGRWVLANAVGELAGLGPVALIAWTLDSSMEGQETLWLVWQLRTAPHVVGSVANGILSI